MVFQHEFSWSASRAGGFATCRRRYYFDYYLSWNGWNASAPQERRTAYLLKKMTRMPMLAGDLVHQAIQHWYAGREQGRVGTLEECTGWVTDQLRSKYKESRDGKGGFVKGLKQLFGSEVALFSLDPESTRKRGQAPDHEVYITYDQVGVEDVIALQDELQLNPTASESAYLVYAMYKRKWLRTLLSLDGPDV